MKSHCCDPAASTFDQETVGLDLVHHNLGPNPAIRNEEHSVESCQVGFRLMKS